jgi:hypothetical protein
MKLAALICITYLLQIANASHFRFGTISWSSITETYPCTDGISGPASVDQPCHLPFSYNNRAHVECTGHNTTVEATAVCKNTCSYPQDGDCDDGGVGSKYSVCELGTDCADCGTRSTSIDGDGFFAGPSGWCATSSNYNSAQNWGGCKMCTKTKKIRLKVHLAYRRSGVGGTKWIRQGDNNAVGDTYSAGLYVRWGDGKYMIPNPMQVTSGGLASTWADSLGEFTHDYDESFLATQENNANGGFEVILRHCCRIRELKNNNNAYYQIKTFVNVSDFRRGGSGPESSQVPMVQIPQSSVAQQFDVSGYSESAGGTAANGNLKFSWSSGIEMGVGQINSSRKRYNGNALGMALNSVTGQLSWVTSDVALGLYSASVKVMDITTSSYTLVDFIVKIVPPPPKFCSFTCLKAGGVTCISDQDCNLDACSAILETGTTVSTDANSFISYGGGGWSEHMPGARKYKRAMPLVAVGQTCEVSRQYCTPSLNRQRRGYTSQSTCETAGYCWDSISQVCHAKACVDNAVTNRIALFHAPPMGSYYEHGEYHVHIRFPERNARNRRRMATNVNVRIRHASGIAEHTVDSASMAHAAWHSLGMYTFNLATNLALQSSTTQSSTEHGGASSLAVDGDIVNVDDVGGRSTCTKTRTGQSEVSWWRVDLGTSSIIEEVVIIGKNNDIGSNRLEVRVGDNTRNQNALCGDRSSDSSHIVDAMGTTVHVLCNGVSGILGRYVDILSTHPIGTTSPGLALCEVKVYALNSVAGYVQISTADADGIVVADAVRFEPTSSSMRSTCGEDAPASLSFLNLPASSIISGAIGDEIIVDVQALDQNPLQRPTVQMIGAPTPNATFEQLTIATAMPERGLLMEVYQSGMLSRTDQCRCDEFGSILGEPKTAYVPNINHDSFHYKLMSGLSELGYSESEYTSHIKIRWTGQIRIPKTGEYTFRAQSDDCVTIDINGQNILTDLGCHGPRWKEVTVSLTSGRFPFQATFSERDGRSGIVLKWSGPGIAEQVIPESAFRDSVVDQDRQYIGCVTTKVPGAGNGRIKNWHGICLDASQRNRRGGRVHMWTCNSRNKNQQWIHDASTGQIKNKHGICLDASQRNTRGGKVHMWTCNTNNNNQQWVYDVSTGQIKNQHGICLDASQRNRRGGLVHMWTCNTSNKNQQFKLNTVYRGGRTRVPLSVRKGIPSLKVGTSQKGYCVKANNRDENSGVIKLYGGNVRSNRQKRRCVRKCLAHSGGGATVTGCEAIWNQRNRGCYVHTSRAITHGNKVNRHTCWLVKQSSSSGTGTLSGAMSLDKCQSMCSAYTYFATTKGNQCWCGNKFGLTGPTSQSCNVPCEGDAHQICGGNHGSHSVYRVNTQSLRALPTYRLKWIPQRAGGFPLIATAQSEGEGATSRSVYVSVRAENACPTNIVVESLQAVSETEDNALRQMVAYLNTIDSNVGDQHLYTVVSTSLSSSTFEVIVGRRGNDGSTTQYNTTEIERPILILTGGVIDFESTPFIDVVVSSSDGICAVETTIHVSVLDVNERPGPPSLNPINPTITETAPIGTFVADISSSDPDRSSSQQLVCRFDCRCPRDKPCLDEGANICSTATGASGTCSNAAHVHCTDSHSFYIDRSTISSHVLLDFETKTAYRLRVQCSDIHGLQSMTTTHEIQIVNANERPTSIGWVGRETFGYMEVLESVAAGTVVGTLLAIDQDASDTFTYGKASVSSIFSVASNGEVIINNEQRLDYEEATAHKIVVNVTDSGTPPLSYTTSLTIRVLDVEEKPTVQDVQIHVAEDVYVGSYIGSVQAISNDWKHPTVTYAIDRNRTPWHDVNKFNLDSTTGEIRVAEQLSFADNATHTIVVVVEAGLSADVYVTVHVGDTPTPPTINDVIATIGENQAVGAQVVASVVGDDPDGDNSAIKYTILGGNHGQTFAMRRDDGRVTVQRRNAPDYETMSSFLLLCEGTDESGNTTSFTITIGVSDVNEAPFVQHGSFSSRIVYELEENARSGTTVTSLQHFDIQDPEDHTYTYTVVGTNPSEYWASDSLRHHLPDGTLTLSGRDRPALTLNTEGVLDHETAPLLGMTVWITDSVGARTETIFWVRVLDSPERPTFAKSVANDIYHVFENTPEGTFTGPFLSKFLEDPDQSSRGRHEFFLHGNVGVHGSASGFTLPPFMVNSQTGQLRVAYAFDHESISPPMFRVVVGVRDESGLTDTVILTLIIDDVNEAPALNDDPVRYIEENSPSGTALYDPDGGDSFVCGTDPDENDLLYMNLTNYDLGIYSERIDGTNSNYCFHLISNTAFNHEVISNYGEFTLKMNVLDSQNLTSELVDMTVRIVDVNEPPLFPAFVRSIDLTYSLQGDSVGAVIIAMDPDVNDTLTYEIISGNTGTPFEGLVNTNDNTYQLVTTRDDLTTGGSGIVANTPVLLTVRATDFYGLSADGTITINIVQSNRAPILTPVNFTVRENSPGSNTFIGSIAGLDPDGTELSWSIVSISSSAVFTMDNSGGLHQHVNNNIDYEMDPKNIILRVSATDGELSSSVPIFLTVIDVNEPPVHNNVEMTISEGVQSDNVVRVLNGKDPENDVLSYTILSGNERGHFALATVGVSLGDANGNTHNNDNQEKQEDNRNVISATIDTGVVVSTISGLNYEVDNRYHLVVRITDRVCGCLHDVLQPCSNDQDGTCHGLYLSSSGEADGTLCGRNSSYLCGGQHSLVQVSINVTDANDVPILESGQEREVRENVADGVLVGSPLRAFDEDVDASLTWVLQSCVSTNQELGGEICPICLDATTGALSVSLSSGARLDHETAPVWSLRILVQDQWGASSTIENVIVNVIDVNERPAIARPTINRTISENAERGVVVSNGTIVGEDQDAATTLQYRVVGTSPMFQVDPSSGEIKLHENAAYLLNYEQKAVYFLRVEAMDDGNPPLTSVTTEVQIHVVDINEPPVIPKIAVTTIWTVREMSPNGTILKSENTIHSDLLPNTGGVNAWDPENETLLYSLVPSDEGAESADENYPIGIHPLEGMLVVVGDLDFETVSLYTFDVIVADEVGLRDSVSMSVIVMDANEPPVLSNDTYTFYVAEDEEVRQNIGEPCTATDLDEEQDLTYTVRVVSSSTENLLVYNMTTTAHSVNDDDNRDNSDSSDNSEMFGIVDCSGQLVLLRPLDYESQHTWTLEVTATDNGAVPKTDVSIVDIIVLDVNEAPSIVRRSGSATIEFSVNENAADGTVVGRVVASDPESDTLVYSIDSLTEEMPFAIDTATGTIRSVVSSSSSILNHEVDDPKYRFTVVVSDVGKDPVGSDEISVIVHILNVQESPLWSAGTVTDNTILYVSEHSKMHNEIGSEYFAEDEDVEDQDAIQYTMVTSDMSMSTSPFALDPNTGQLTLERPTFLNYENKTSYVVTVTATDSSGMTANHVTTIQVIDENDAPLLLNSNGALSVNENSISGTLVGVPLTVIDVDSNQQHAFELLAGSEHFNIHEETGQLSLRINDGDDDADFVVLDYESLSTPYIHVHVRVEDNGMPPMASEIILRIQINDINEPPAWSAMSTTTRTLLENSSPLALVGVPVQGIDPDQDDILTYSMETSSTLTMSLFEIDPSTGQLRVKADASSAALNYEATNVHVVHVRATDTSGAFATVVVNIELEDVNEAPVVIAGALATDVSASAGSYIGQGAMAIDPDFDQIVTCRLVDPTDLNLIPTTTGLLNMNEHDGTVRVADGATLGVSPRTFDVVVGCKDSGSPPMEVLVTVQVTFYDTNQPPTFPDSISTVTTFTLSENSEANTIVGVPLLATDPNVGDIVTYTLLSEAVLSRVSGNSTFSSSPMLFEMDPNTAQVSTRAITIDHERIHSISLLIEARDNGFGQLRTTTEINIIIQDVNEPPFAPAATKFYIAENSLDGTLVGTVTTNDPEDDTLRYRLLSSSSFFRLSASGTLYISGNTLDYEMSQEHVLTVAVEDDGNPSLSTSFTLKVHVLNQNDAPSIVGGQTFAVEENADVETVVGIPIQWSDEDNYQQHQTRASEEVSKGTFSVERSGCFSVDTPSSSDMSIVSTPNTMRPTFLNVTVRISKDIDERAMITLRSVTRALRVTIGASGNTKTLIESCTTYSSTNVVCTPVATTGSLNILKGNRNKGLAGAAPTWILIQLTNTSLTVSEKLSAGHNPVVSAANLQQLLSLPLSREVPTCSMDSGLVLSYDAQCNTAERPNDNWIGRTSVGLPTTTPSTSLDMRNVEYFTEEGGYYHFDNIVKNIPTTLNPTKFPELTLEVYFRTHRTSNNRGWIMCSDDRRGGYDRGINIHDSRFGARPAAIAGTNYRSTLPKVRYGEWTHLVATFKNGEQSQLCMTSPSNSVTSCNTYVPRNIGTRGNGLLNHFNLGGCQTWRRHTVDADIAVVNVYNRLLTKTDVERRYNLLKRRSSATTSNIQTDFGPNSIGFSTELGTNGQMEGCFGTIDAEESVPFSIHSETGQLSTTVSLNYEHRAEWGLQIRVADDGGRQDTVNDNNIIFSVSGRKAISNRIVTVRVVDINEKPTFDTACTAEQSRDVLREYSISLRGHLHDASTNQFLSIDTSRNSVKLKHINPLSNGGSKEASSFKVVSGLWDPRGYSISWGEGTRARYLSTLTSKYTYKGCYSDNGRRDLQRGPKRYGYNADTCRAACLQYSYFSLQHGGQCFCDSSFATPASTYRKMPEAQCNRNGGFRNGGAWRNAVYQNHPANGNSLAPKSVSWLRQTQDNTFKKSATWTAVQAIGGSSTEGTHMLHISLKTMDDPPLYLITTGEDMFTLMTLENIGSNSEYKNRASFQVEDPLTKPTHLTLHTRTWMWNIGTQRRSGRDCSLQPFDKRTAHSLRSYDGTTYMGEWYMAKWACNNGHVGVPLSRIGNRLVALIGTKKCVMDIQYEAAAPGVLNENEHSVWFNCHPDATGVPLSLNNERLYAVLPSSNAGSSSSLKCGLLWDINFGSLPNDRLSNDETLAKVHCLGNANSVEFQS